MADVLTLQDLRQKPVEDAAPQETDARLWSVTSILKAIGSNDALIGWAAARTADAAIDDEAVWKSRLEREGRDSARKYLTESRYKPEPGKLGASDLGSQFHEAAERYVLDGERPTDLHPQVESLFVQFDRWLQTFTPTYEAAEVTVYSPTYGYAGTSDAFIELDGSLYIVDYKTSAADLDGRGKPKKPWKTVALQLAAYRFAEFAAVWRPRRFEKYRRRYYLLDDAEREQAHPVPEVAGGICIYVTPERCEAYPVRCDKTRFETFLYAIDIASWEFQEGRNDIGTPLVPPAREEAS